MNFLIGDGWRKNEIPSDFLYYCFSKKAIFVLYILVWYFLS